MQLQQKVAELQQHNAQLSADLTQTTDTLTQQAQAEINTLRAENARLTSEVVQLRTECAQLRDSINQSDAGHQSPRARAPRDSSDSFNHTESSDVEEEEKKQGLDERPNKKKEKKKKEQDEDEKKKAEEEGEDAERADMRVELEESRTQNTLLAAEVIELRKENARLSALCARAGVANQSGPRNNEPTIPPASSPGLEEEEQGFLSQLLSSGSLNNSNSSNNSNNSNSSSNRNGDNTISGRSARKASLSSDADARVWRDRELPNQDALLRMSHDFSLSLRARAPVVNNVSGGSTRGDGEIVEEHSRRGGEGERKQGAGDVGQMRALERQLEACKERNRELYEQVIESGRETELAQRQTEDAIRLLGEQKALASRLEREKREAEEQLEREKRELEERLEEEQTETQRLNDRGEWEYPTLIPIRIFSVFAG